jgi:uncharacterized membrane protein YphA (DoxX/SURF4 family)
MSIADSPPSNTATAKENAARTNRLAAVWHSIPLPRGPNWYLVTYRWLVVAAALYTVTVTWTVWQVRSGPEYYWTPMLPLWPGLPEFNLGWLVVASLLMVLVRPWIGLIAYCLLLGIGMVLDLSRIQPPFLIMFLLLATMPNPSAQLLGRANLIAMWFWAGLHKLLIDFIKPADLPGFRSTIIPNDLARHFSPDKFSWSTPALGNAIGWAVCLTEIGLAVMCLIPRTRRLVGLIALVMHLSIAVWHCPTWHCSVLAWNVALAFAGLALIAPWKESTWTSLRQCNIAVRVAAVFLLVYPAAYYMNWINAYLAHCIYVPNTPNAILHRPGDPDREIAMSPVEITRVPLPPGHEIYERYFDKIKQPGDTLVIHDPRPWAQHNGMNGRQITDDGELRDGAPVGHWVRRDSDGQKQSEGDIEHGVQTGHWIYWYPDGSKAMEGNYVDGKLDGTWMFWEPGSNAIRVEYRRGERIGVAPAK